VFNSSLFLYIYLYIFDPFILIIRLNCLRDNSVIFPRVLIGGEVCDLDVGLR
jgi:hypothetical protein